MSGQISNRFLKALRIREEEASQVLWLFLHYFFQGFGIALFFTVASTLFLSLFSAEKLPLVYMVSAVTLIAVARIYTWFEHKLPLRKLMPMVIGTLLVSVLFSRFGLMVGSVAAMAFFLMVWHRVIFLLANLEFWGVSSLLLNVRQGKRLFGLISAGDIPAKLLGFLSVSALVPFIGLPNLLLIAAASFLASIYFLSRILAHPILSGNAGETEPHSAEPETNAGGFIKRIFKSKFILLLALLSFLIVSIFTLIDFAFLTHVQLHFKTEIALASFLGLFFSVGQGFTIISKVAISLGLPDRLGMRKSLLILPVLLLSLTMLAVCAKFFAGPAMLFWILGLMVLMGETLKFTLNDPIFMGLYQPLPRQHRLHGHSLVEGLFDPLGIGIAGLLILLSLKWLGIVPLDYINYLLVILLAAWIFLVVLISKNYLLVLANAIKKHYLEGREILIKDKASLAVLYKKLKSQHPEEVIYAVELLQKIGANNFSDSIKYLLNSPLPQVQRFGLNRIEALGINELQPEVFKMVQTGTDPEVIGAALRAYCRLAEEPTGLVEPFLVYPDLTIRKGALTGLMKSGGIEAVILAGNELLQLINSAEERERALAAEVIGDLRIRNFYLPISRFIEDKALAVRRTAIEAAGKIKNQKLIPQLFSSLSETKLRQEVINALAEFGEPAIDLAADEIKFASEQHDIGKCLSLGRICAKTGSQKAVKLLLMLLFTSPNQRIRTNALYLLRTIRYQAPEQEMQPFLQLLDKCLDQYYLSLRAYQLLASNSYLPLAEALKTEAGIMHEFVFNLLAIIYGSKTIAECKSLIEKGVPEEMGTALEILDNLLPRKVFVRLEYLLEPIGLNEKLNLLAAVSPDFNFSLPELLDFILSTGAGLFNEWTIALSLLTIKDFSNFNSAQISEQYLQSSALILRQSATLPVHSSYRTNNLLSGNNVRTDMELIRQGSAALLEVEKVVVLKSTSIFSETPENILVDIAAIVVEQRVRKGEEVFRKGDFGADMYIIYQGEIRIHDGRFTFATLNNREIFGELALLDPEPRSATATAVFDTLLLKLEQEAFFELMADRREVAKGILKILTKRLRAQNELIKELKAAKLNSLI